MRVVTLTWILLAVAAPARADRKDDLAAVAPAIPACDADRAHCIGLQVHVAADDTSLVVTRATR